MPTIYQTANAVGKSPSLIAHASELITMRLVYPLNVAMTAGDEIEMFVLPADHVPVDVMIDADRLDSNASPTLTVTCGLMSGTSGVADATRTVGTEFGSALTTIGRAAGGSMARCLTRPGAIFADPSRDRSIGISFPAAAATFTADSTAITLKGLWQAATAYASGDAITLPDGRRARCSSAGTSGTAFPFVGTEVKGGTVTDGGVTWTIVDAYIALTIAYRATRMGF